MYPNMHHLLYARFTEICLDDYNFDKIYTYDRLDKIYERMIAMGYLDLEMLRISRLG